jgi:hypothetical protein
MASTFELSIATSAVGTGAPSFEFVANGRPASILEIEISNTAATAASFILGRPGNTPTTGTQVTATLPINLPPGGVVSTAALVITGWGTAPTIPTAGNSIRRIGLAAAIGNGWLGVWPQKEFMVSPTRSSGLILWNASAVGIVNVRVKWEE